MVTEENPNAGQGSVVLDIGGDIGALIVVMPAEMEDLEVEIVPTGTDARPPESIDPENAAGTAAHSHAQPEHGHEHGPEHDHVHEHDHDHDGSQSTHPTAAAPPHVAVVGRPTPGGDIVHSLVYGALLEGSYDLYVRPFGPVHLTATVIGGQVTETRWD
ncbi:MAG: hypothetical protein ACR2M5_08250 [Nakamurella sp.]